MGKKVYPILVKGDLLSAVPVDLTNKQYIDIRPDEGKTDPNLSQLPRLTKIIQEQVGVTPPPPISVSPSAPQRSKSRSNTIFVSAPFGRNLSEEQQAIKKYLVDLLVRQEFKPLLIGEVGEGLNMPWTFDGVIEVMAECAGAIMLGLARWNCIEENGIYRFATEYTHFEGALALAYDLPTLIIKEYDVSERGIFYTGGGRFIITLPPTNAVEWLASEGFQQRFSAWREAVQTPRETE
jgi:hypothetical protein